MIYINEDTIKIGYSQKDFNSYADFVALDDFIKATLTADLHYAFNEIYNNLGADGLVIINEALDGFIDDNYKGD